MNKGFTLIELLIVMIIVALLVSISVPKYKTAMEKARAQEGITNLTLAADQANAYYMTHDGSYSGVAGYLAGGSDKTKKIHFNDVTVTGSGGTASMSAARSNGRYTLTISLSGGKVASRGCTGSGDEGIRMCDAIGWGG